MLNQLENKVVLITGASSGIGWATAHAFAQEKSRLILVARRQDRLEDLARRLQTAGTESLALPCDVSNNRQIRETVEKAAKKWGRLDFLINNAGISRTKPFLEHAPEEIENILKTNTLGTMHMTHAVLPHMKEQGSGHIVNVSSVAGIVGLPYMAPYCASKFALVGFTQALRAELYGTGITLTALCPGTVDTPMAEEPLRDPQLRKKVRPKTAEEVAKLILKVCIHKIPEAVFGEVPGTILKLARFFPKLTDWATHTAYKKYHPLVRKWNPI